MASSRWLGRWRRVILAALEGHAGGFALPYRAPSPKVGISARQRAAKALCRLLCAWWQAARPRSAMIAVLLPNTGLPLELCRSRF